jgi:hypothetical protein
VLCESSSDPSISNVRVRATSEVFMDDVKVQHQCERGQQFDQPPSRDPSWHPSGRAISVRRTESSIVATMRYCIRRRSTSARRETTNLSLRSWKDCQCLRICVVTLCWWACWNHPLPSHGRFHEGWKPVALDEDRTPAVVHHRLVSCDQHELSHQTETGGTPCPCNCSYLEDHCGCHGEKGGEDIRALGFLFCIEIHGNFIKKMHFISHPLLKND